MVIKFLFFLLVPPLLSCQGSQKRTEKNAILELHSREDKGQKVVNEGYNNRKSTDKVVEEESVKASRNIVAKKATYQGDVSNVIKYLPANFSKKGDVDYTNFIQKAVNSEKKVILPNFPIAVNFKGINLQSNSILQFQEYSQLIMLPNNKENYGLLNIRNKNNVTIISPNLLGDREAHIGKTGEWGMGINILSSSNITIKKPKISKFWGDAIYLGRDKSGKTSNEDIIITGGVLSNNRRNGISIISAKRLTISYITIKDTKGTAPEAGIDLEPNDNIEELQNIILQNVTTVGNRRGILIALNHFGGNNRKKIDVQIDNHIDNSSIYALGLALQPKNQAISSPVEGNIRVSSANWSNNQDPIQYYELKSNNINVAIDDLVLSGQKKSISDVKKMYNNNKRISIYGK